MPFFTPMPEREFEKLQIGLASPEQILAWSHGEVQKPETINYRTFKPERKGLFCEMIFGPVKDWECHCGKYRRVRYRGIICERCGVEVTTSRVRRDRMGHIKLAVPVTHVWYLKGVPGYISLMLGMTTRSLEEAIYYDAYLVTEAAASLKGKLSEGQILREAEYQEAKEKYGNQFKAEMGAKAVEELLHRINIPNLVRDLRRDLKGATGQKRMRIIKRLRVAEAFFQSGNRPEWMVLEVLPVMPPDLRPMVQLEGGRFATSDLNDLYRRVLNRNNRLKKMISMGAPDMIIRNEKRMLQEAVDVLIDNGRRKRPVTGPNGRPLKSLSDIIEGKQGRFRQNLLGKRADYSGRSVIVVGPNLKLNQCGLPKEMALELFKPFVIHKLIEKGHSQNVKSAKRMIERREVVVWDMLEEVTRGHTVLLNRAPTLHRLGIQAFEPILVEGKAIHIHPLVCTAFNADFDGDQMAVHVPLLTEAQTEARIIMLSANNLLSPASGRPVITPTQDMVLGTYYMTCDDPRAELGKGWVFADDDEAMISHDLEKIDLHALIRVRRGGSLLETTVGRIKFNHTIRRVISRHGASAEWEFVNDPITKKRLEQLIIDSYRCYGSTVTAEIADEIKRLGFKYATLAGFSISIDDLRVPPEKKTIIEKASREAEAVERSYRSGHLSASERLIRSLDIWSRVTEDVTAAMINGYEKFDPLNSVYTISFSGARGSMQQVRQLAGIRGLMADPSGNIISIPIRTNFKEGLNVTEYFISSYGARKGLVDTALRTADSGYLTRRLVDVAQDVMITEDDCETDEYLTLRPIMEGYEEVLPVAQRAFGRIVFENVKDPFTGEIIVRKGEAIDDRAVVAMAQAGITQLKVRTVLGCRVKRGLCKKCYATDLSSGNLVNEGEAVGIIAAQSIGEPGTQLTMRTFHIGGVAVHKAVKVTIKAKHKGRLKFGAELFSKASKDDEGNTVNRVTRESRIILETEGKSKEEYVMPVGALLYVRDKASVAAGDTLAEYDPTYEYVIASSGGKLRYLGVTLTERHGEKRSRTDGEVFVYNPKSTQEIEVAPDREVLVEPGVKVRPGTEVAAGLPAKISGLVLEVVRRDRPRKGTRMVMVAAGESYPIPAGTIVMAEDGAVVSPYDILARVEAIRRDPSKTRDIIQGLPRVEELFEARKPKEGVLLSETDGQVEITEREGKRQIVVHGKDKREYAVPYETRLRVASGDKITAGTPLTVGTVNPHDILRILGVGAVQAHLVEEIQKIYRSQGVTINDKHLEVIIRQMTRRVRVLRPGDTALLPGELIDANELEKVNQSVKGEPATGTPVLLGITKASLSTDSFISAASFQETARILTDVAIKGKVDEMRGLKENVIIGKLIPAGTGIELYQNVVAVPVKAEVEA